MKKLICLAIILPVVTGLQLATLAAPAHKHPAKVIAEPLYNVNISAGAWEGVQVLVKLTLAGHTVMKSSPASSKISLRVNGLKSGIYTATVSLLKTDLLNVNQGNQIQTILEYIMRGYGGAVDTYGYGCAIAVISIGDYTYPNTSLAIPGFYDLSMAWGKDVSQIPELPLGKLPFGRYRIGDTCKIVFFVGPPNTTIQDIEALQASGAPKDDQTNINWITIYNWEASPKEATTMSVPNNHGIVIGTSGPTIAHGVDLGQPGHNQAWLNSLNLGAALSAQLSPYLNMRGQPAFAYVIAHPLMLNQSQVNQIDQALQPYEAALVVKHFNTDVGDNQAFQKLPEPVQTVYASVYYQYFTKAPTVLSCLEQADFAGAISELRNIDHWEHPLSNGLQNRRELEAQYLQNAINNGVLAGTHQ